MMLLAFLYGVTSMGCGIVALFFVRYYQLTKDELFVWFALAFAAFMANWTVLASGWLSEATSITYGLRLVGFILLSIGILRKNRAPTT
ncbi:MAG TPA: DUF5985 family protein [Kofleriaceae bacterium]|jgi:hypothetical protein